MKQGGKIALKFTFPAGLGTNDAYTLSVLDNFGNRVSDEFSLHGNDYAGRTIASQTFILPAGRNYVAISGYSSDLTWGKTYQLTALARLTQTPTPTISGTAKAGKTLTAKAGTWKPSGVKLAYQWKRNGVSIKGATKSPYKVTNADLGKKLTVTVTGSKSGYASVAKTSKATSIPWLKLTSTPTPTISGTAKAGKTLKAKAGTWKPSPVKVTYQWKRNGKAIKGATKSSYKLTNADKNKSITVSVKGAKTYYASVTKTSKAKKIAK